MIPSTEGEPAGLPDAAVLAAAVARMDRVGRGDGGTVDDDDGDGDDCTSDDGGTSDDDQNQDVNQGVDAAQAGGIGEDDDLDDVRFDQDGGRGPMHQVVSDEDLDRMMDLDGGANAGAGLQHAFDIEDGDPADGGPGHGRPPAGCCGRVARRCCPCLPPCYGIGNATVLLPWLYERTGRYGVIGPHWLGLVASSSLLFAASYYYIGRAILVGPFSAAFSVAMTAQCTVTLFMVAFSDPGIVTSMGPHQGGVGSGGGEWGGREVCGAAHRWKGPIGLEVLRLVRSVPAPQGGALPRLQRLRRWLRSPLSLDGHLHRQDQHEGLRRLQSLLARLPHLGRRLAQLFGSHAGGQWEGG